MQKLVRYEPPEAPMLQLTGDLHIDEKIIILVNKNDKRVYFVIQDADKGFMASNIYAGTMNHMWHSTLEGLMKMYDSNHDLYIFNSFREAIETIAKEKHWWGHFDINSQ